MTGPGRTPHAMDIVSILPIEIQPRTQMCTRECLRHCMVECVDRSEIRSPVIASTADPHVRAAVMESLRVARRQYHSVMRERAAASTRAHILQAAAEVFASKGYPLTTINEIAAHAEVGVNTVYTVFGTKANLLATLINDAIDNPVIACAAPEDTKTGPAVIRDLAQVVRDNTERGYAVYEVGSQNLRADPQIAEAMHAAQKKIRREVGSAVERLIGLGVLRPDLGLEEATDILYFFLGPPAWHSLFTIGWPIDRARDFLAEQACRALLRRGRRSSS
jgi:AcrR family transcriptional regulator